MASSLPPVKGAAFTFDICLVSQADTDVFKTSPTLAAGDVTVSLDGGNYANITSLPSQIQTTGVLPVALSAAEMTADRVTVKFHDAAGDEWQDALVTIYTAAQTLDTTDAVADAIKAKTDYLPSATAGAAGGVFIAGSNAATSITTALTANVTGNLSGSVGSVTGAVGSVTGNVGGNVTGSVGSVAAGGITAASIATGAIDADAIASAAITAAKFAAGAVDAAALSDDAVDAILDEVVEGSYTMRQLLRGFAAVLLGKSTNAGADYRDTGDTKTRVNSTLDGSSNRTAVTLDLE